MHQARSARLAGALFRRLATSIRPTGEPACEYHKLLVGLDFKFFPDPLSLRRDAFLSVTEFQSNFLVCLPACESPQQLLLARAYLVETDFVSHRARLASPENRSL